MNDRRERARSATAPGSRRFPWHVVVAAVAAGVIGVAARALLAPLGLFPIVEWGLAILIGVVVGLVVANVALGIARRR